ncbi:MAG: type II toxin-antitoxin system VapC family toxin [Cyanobacteria bacterium P01_C01_bin.72]
MGGRTIKGILLDTHTWIWLFEKSSELTTEIVDEINHWGKQGKVYISAISVWELSVLTAKGRIVLNKPIRDWVEESLNQPGVCLVELSPEAAIESNFLPGDFHGDPADRIICATARLNDLILFTRDKKIIQYSQAGNLHCQKI